MPSLTWKGRKGLREELLCGGFLGARSQMSDVVPCLPSGIGAN
jgi:hypothetical protein